MGKLKKIRFLLPIFLLPGFKPPSAWHGLQFRLNLLHRHRNWKLAFITLSFFFNSLPCKLFFPSLWNQPFSLSLFIFSFLFFSFAEPNSTRTYSEGRQIDNERSRRLAPDWLTEEEWGVRVLATEKGERERERTFPLSWRGREIMGAAIEVVHIVVLFNTYSLL